MLYPNTIEQKLGFDSIRQVLRENCLSSLGQQYVTPEIAILDRGTDIVIVGRGILQADDAVTAAKNYRAASWAAYQSLLNAVCL